MMQANLRRILTTVLVLGLAGGSAAAAQQEEQQEQQEQHRMQEAQRRAEEALRQLEKAVQALRQAESAEARRQLEDAMRELRSAQRELNRGRALRFYAEALPRGEGVVSGVLALGSSGPKMGVYLSTDQNAAIDSVGVRLDRVVDDGPADKAGLEDGDIITTANGEPLSRTSRRGTSPANKLIKIKDELEIGDTLRVEYRRGSDTRTASIVLDELEPSSWAYSITADSIDFRGEPFVYTAPRIRVETPGVGVRVPSLLAEFGQFPLSWLDVELVTLDEDLGQYFGTTEGLLVIRAPEDDEIDLRSGDVILNVDGRVPTSQSHLVRMLRSYEAGESMQIEIMRNRSRQVVEVAVPEREGFSWSRRGRF